LAISGKFARPSSEQQDAHCLSSFAISALLFDPPQHPQQEEWEKNPGGKAAHIEDETKFLLDIMHSQSHTMLTMTRLLWKIST
jgi:hypothetical protein